MHQKLHVSTECRIIVWFGACCVHWKSISDICFVCQKNAIYQSKVKCTKEYAETADCREAPFSKCDPVFNVNVYANNNGSNMPKRNSVAMNHSSFQLKTLKGFTKNALFLGSFNSQGEWGIPYTHTQYIFMHWTVMYRAKQCNKSDPCSRENREEHGKYYQINSVRNMATNP